jgi:hypothetical protein
MLNGALSYLETHDTPFPLTGRPVATADLPFLLTGNAASIYDQPSCLLRTFG